MTQQAFAAKIAELVSVIGPRAVDSALGEHLQRQVGPDSALFARIETLCRAGVDQGWLCRHQAGGIRYGRVIRPGAEAAGYSVDVVLMDDCRGPHHSHPGGEIDMVMPIDAGAKFDGHPAGWVVYPPGSAHTPTVSGGAALVLYLLPGGEIKFTDKDN